jgi:hypothetical protein
MAGALLAGCSYHEHYLSFPVTRGLIDAFEGETVTIGNELEAAIIVSAVSFTFLADLFAGIYTFPHDFGLWVLKSVRGTSGRVSYESTSPGVRRMIEKRSKRKDRAGAGK